MHSKCCLGIDAEAVSLLPAFVKQFHATKDSMLIRPDGYSGVIFQPQEPRDCVTLVEGSIVLVQYGFV